MVLEPLTCATSLDHEVESTGLSQQGHLGCISDGDLSRVDYLADA